MGSVNATLVTLATTVTAPWRRRPVFRVTGGCATGVETACAAAVSVLSQGHLETRVKNAPPAPTPVALKGKSTSGTHYTPGKTTKSTPVI